MSRNFLSPYFFVTWFALGIAFGLFWLGTLRSLQGTLDILLLPREAVALVAPGNAEALILSQTFQKSVLDVLESQGSPVEREFLEGSRWERAVRASVLPETSVLRIEVNLETRSEAQALLEGVKQQLVARLSEWYHMEKELELRIIDGPRLTTRVSSWSLLVLASLGSSLAVTGLFFFGLLMLERFLKGRQTSPSSRDAYQISPETFRPKPVAPYWSQEEIPPASPAVSEIPKDMASPFVLPARTLPENPREDQVSKDLFSEPNPADVISLLSDEEPELRPTPIVTDIAPEKSTHQPLPVAESAEVEETIPERATTRPRASEGEVPRAIATGPAPNNLPVLDDLSPLEAANAALMRADINATTALQSAVAEADLVSVPNATSPQPQTTGEPSQEEYKRRLNELLSGKL